MDLTSGLVQQGSKGGQGEAGLANCIPSESKVCNLSDVDLAPYINIGLLTAARLQCLPNLFETVLVNLDDG